MNRLSVRVGRLLAGVSIALVALSCWSSSAAADERRPAKADAVKADSAGGDDDNSATTRRDPDNVTAISEFMVSCTEGEHRYLSRDFIGAVKSFRSAIQLSPKSPLGYFYLGEAQLAAGNIDEAEASFRQAELVADSRHPDIRAHVLFMVADVLERQKKWPLARSAWQAYLEWAGKFPDAGVFPASATSRIEAIDAAAKLDKRYEIVRKRIADTGHGNVYTEVH